MIDQRNNTELPLAIRRDIASFAVKLRRDYRTEFGSKALYRKRAGQFLTALLPPKPRRRGRPGRPDVTRAIQLLKLYRRQYPDECPAQHWARLYPAVIPGYQDMNPTEQRDARERLRERVRWRKRFEKVKKCYLSGTFSVPGRSPSRGN
jgi:hypothetical protein